VTWQLGAFALLGLALAGGFAWYERERPDARIVALVGTLAAFAALGRIAFAAVPNVKPTTDIVLISGYALGAGPGFAVGALAGLSSNFFFGQGPWTPWQMAAWGAAGIIGAALARFGPRRGLGRWPLAIVCCLVGFGFTALQDVGDWVSFSDHSLAQLGVYVGQGFGFDAIHAAGCLAFALAFGPALTRSIERFARRLQVVWLSAGGVGAPVLVLALVAGAFGMLGVPGRATAATAMAPEQARHAAAAYLVGAENADGGFGPAPGQPSNQLYAGWAALGLASAGYDIGHVARTTGLLAYVQAGAGTSSDVGALERTILVARAAGLPARSFGGHDLVAELQRRIARNGSVSGQVNLTSFAVLAQRGAGGRAGPSARTLRWLAGQQDSDGGFSFSGAGGGSDIDDTGAVLEALAGDAGARPVISRAVAFLRREQNRDGGFPSQPGSGSNAQSTAWAIQGLDAVGVSVTGVRHRGSPSPLAYLDSLALPSGAIRYSGAVTQTPVWVTSEALMAMEGTPLPVAAPPAAPAASPKPPVDGGPARSAPASPGRATTSRRRAGAGGNAVAQASGRGAAPGTRAVAAPAAGTGDVAHLAGVVGALTALVLAPIGLG
jgi:energy-coupling factor transport system substrate-specific component